MSGFASRTLAAGALSALLLGTLGTDTAAQASRPDFMTGTAWLGGGSFIEIPGSTPTPVRQDPRYRYVPNNTNEQPTYRIGDITNPNLKQWVRDVMKKDNDEVLKGKIADETGEYEKGEIVFLDPRSVHTPFAIGETVVLVLWPAGVRLMD